MTTTRRIETEHRTRSGGAITAWVVLGVVSGLGMTYGLAAMHGESIINGTTTLTPATAVGVAALCYLAAAATRTRWVAWLGVPVFSGLAFAGLLGVLPWWTLFVLAAVVLLGVGVLLGAGQVTAVQAAALLGYFGMAIVALQLSVQLGLAIAGVTLAAHAFWDVKHYRSDEVVFGSLAIFCIGLDLTVGAICVALAIAG
ncbi:hypothetical protein [Occultella gossypii]|uniref:Uncharacterized protein n=1 Tax=Occultella gossypii TaxID=2800820 RepID=A0ABS7SE84_9MICO|nr:hypothetical protein [Occultella gossypii]MBZ2197576.1 hypothetical protein [Occultella gossypii]